MVKHMTSHRRKGDRETEDERKGGVRKKRKGAQTLITAVGRHNGPASILNTE